MLKRSSLAISATALIPLILKFCQSRFKQKERLLFLPLLLAALLQGCPSVVDSGSILSGLGFASDTTAILFYELWEETNTPSIPVSRSGTNYLGWELKLVDVRYNKVYWSARIDHSHRNTQILRSQQWNDSTMFIELTGEGYWLWTVGNKKPQKINFNWNVERENYEKGVLLYDFQLRPWKNDSILIYSKARQAIIDTKTMTVNNWYPENDVWTTKCHDFWWIKNGGVCLFDMSSYAVLLSEKGDTLGNFAYTGEKLIYYEDTLFTMERTSPYWIFGKRNCIDSLRSTAGY